MSLERPFRLLSSANNWLEKIKNEYNLSLTSQTIPDSLLENIRYFLSDIKSALDYVGFKIFEKYCSSLISLDIIEKHKKQVYFPIKETHDKFINYIDRIYPQLKIIQPNIVSVIEKYQPYSSSHWLIWLDKLNNDNKHRDLTPQTRNEEKRINVCSTENGISVNWNPDCVKFGNDVYVAGARINVHTQLPEPNHKIITTMEIWVSFHFNEINLSVLPTLNEIYSNSSNLINELSTVF